MIFKIFLFILYVGVSFPIFNKVFQTSKLVIDEEFHLRQGEHYCKGEFEIWDPKITTFPGLYIFSSIFLLPLKMCSVYFMRLSSLIASVINVWLIYEIRKMNLGIPKKKHPLGHVIETLTISILPPMYFFSHLYYTDILSITTILLTFLYASKQRYNLSAIFGAFSVLMRQTNIVWIGMILGSKVLNKIVIGTMPKINPTKSKKKYDNYTILDIGKVVFYHLKKFDLILNQIKSIFIDFTGYIIVLGAFIVFLLINGSIVVGDKSAHEASLHLPQLMYFSLFFNLFSPGILLTNFKGIFKLLTKKYQVFIGLAIVMAVIIKFNTIVHPYLLADNRHYIFYLWNRFYGKYTLARYIVIPVYLIGFAAIWKILENKSTGFIIFFILSVFMTNALQQLIELRYFIIPYLILRLNSNKIKLKYLVLELILYILINAGTFYIFFTKEIIWSDYKDFQRLIW